MVNKIRFRFFRMQGEKLAHLGTHEALDKLWQALDLHQRRLAEILQSKTGRSALVGAQRKRISLLEALIVDCEHRLHKPQERGNHSV